MEDFTKKSPGHTYFRHSNEPLFGSVKSAVSIAATDFPIMPKDKNLLDIALEGKEGWEKTIDNGAVALTVSSEVFGKTMGGTIILTQEEQDNLILGLLERRGKKGIGKIIERIGLELPDEGVVANSGAKSKFCPSEDKRLSGDESQDKDDCDCPVCQLRRSLESKGRVGAHVIRMSKGDDLFDMLGEILKRK